MVNAEIGGEFRSGGPGVGHCAAILARPQESSARYSHPVGTEDSCQILQERQDRVEVKILFILDGDRRVTDLLNLLKIEDRSRVVNIIDF